MKVVLCFRPSIEERLVIGSESQCICSSLTTRCDENYCYDVDAVNHGQVILK